MKPGDKFLYHVSRANVNVEVVEGICSWLRAFLVDGTKWTLAGI